MGVVNNHSYIPILQVLQCLSGQGLTSSGGSGQVGSEGGNSSGASRAAVKERLIRYTNYSSLLFNADVLPCNF